MGDQMSAEDTKEVSGCSPDPGFDNNGDNDERSGQSQDLLPTHGSAPQERVPPVQRKTPSLSPPRLSPSRVTWKQTSSSMFGDDHSFSGWEQVWDRFTTLQDKTHTIQLLRQWISLPSIAVIGDTSCGKSSLLSQLSGVELPSNSQISTKCPVEMQMRFSQSKQAIIDIQWKHHQSSSQGSGVHRHKLWEERVLRTAEEWKEIPNIIRQAQQVILSRNHHGNQDEPQSTVASDVISVVLTGPMYPKQQTLTLVDLPGLVQMHNAMTESPTVSKEIVNLLEPYLENPHCLLVAVLPANVDYHNAHVLQLAAQHDPLADRTIPVWTKPDLIDKGAEQAMVDVLQNAKSFLNCRNVHMVKCRGQAALDEASTSLANAVQQEENYFLRTAPWKALDPTLFGTNNLRKKLVQIQARLIAESLPQILADMHAQLNLARQQLAALGGKPLETAGERRQFYQSTCSRLLTQLKTSLSGKGGGVATGRGTSTDSDGAIGSFSSLAHNTNILNGSNVISAPPPPPPIVVTSRMDGGGSKLSSSTVATSTLAANRLHEACAKFTSQIRAGSLATIRTVVEGAQVLVTSARGTVRGEVVHLDEDEGYCCVDMYNSDRQPQAAAAMATSILFEFVGQPFDSETPAMDENDVWSDDNGNTVFIARAGGVYDALRKIPLDCVWTDPTTWLQAHMEQFRTDDLACFLNVESFAHIVGEFMHEDWKPACQALLQSMKMILAQALSQALEQASESPANLIGHASRPEASSLSTDAPPRYPGLRHLLQRHLRKVSDSLCQQAELQVESHLAMEAHPFTQDDALFVKMNRARYARLKRELEVGLLGELDSENISRASKVSSALNNVDTVQNVIDDVFMRQEKMTVQEHLAFEMEIVLESYGEIATRRVLDRTPMICWQAFRSFGNLLSSRLATVTDDDLTDAMVERPEFAQEYQRLNEKCEKLRESIQLLESM